MFRHYRAKTCRDDGPNKDDLMNTSRRRRCAAPIGLIALALFLNACLAPTRAPARVNAPSLGVPSYTQSAGSGPVRSLLTLPPVPFEEDAAAPSEPVTYRARAGAVTAHYGPARIGYAVVGYDPATVAAETVAACQPSQGRRPETCTEPLPGQRW